MEKEITARQLKLITKSWYFYLLSKWKIIFAASALFSVVGILYAWLEKPVYVAEITFVTENEGSGGIGAYANIAAQFGFDLGSSSANAFEGENLIHLMSSRNLVEKTLFSSFIIDRKNYLLINYYLKTSAEGSYSERKKEFVFSKNERHLYSRYQDSVLKKIYSAITMSLHIEKIDKKADIISVSLSDHDELFAKTFVELLVNNVIQYYTDYKVKKTRQNVEMLQRQTDSIRNLLNGNIVDIAVSNDLNVNPTRQVVRTGVQRRQVDAQVNGALYTELVKNLELSKLALRKETPLIQIIDSPVLPLEKHKKGRLLTGIIFALTAAFFIIFFYILKKIFE